jgi:hypothetical protein
MPTTKPKRAKKIETGAVEAGFPVITSIKGFDRDLKCRGFQFEVGKTYEVEGKVEACRNGFHAVENPLDVFSYYPAGTSVFHEVEQSGDLARHAEDSKIASATITIGVQISVGDIVKRGIAWIAKHASATLAASGHAASQGDSGHAASQGDSGHAASQGDRGHAASQGDSGHAASQGDRGHAASQGDRGHAASQGYRGHAASQGDRGHAASQGYSGHAETHGLHSIAVACGYAGRAKAPATGAIMLACISDHDHATILCVRASKVGENGVKPNTWYSLSAAGEFVEVEF